MPEPHRASTEFFRTKPSEVLDVATLNKQAVEIATFTDEDYRRGRHPENVVAVLLPAQRYQELVSLESRIRALAASL